MSKNVEAFKKDLAESAQREKEREAKSLLRRQAAQQARMDRDED